MNKFDYDSYDIVCFTLDDETNSTLVEALSRLGEIQSKIYSGDVTRAIEYRAIRKSW